MSESLVFFWAALSAAFWAWSTAVACRSIYYPNPFPEMICIADFVRQHTKPDDQIAVLGSEPEIYFYADRRSATGYIYTYALMEPHKYASQMQREMMRAREGHSEHIERLVKTYFQPIYKRVGELLQKGIAEGEFRKVDPAHFVPSMVSMIVFYFSSAPVMQRIVRFNPLAPERIAERRAAVLDFISAALFQPRATTMPGVRK